MIDLPPSSTVTQIVVALVECGLDRRGIVTAYSDELQSDVLTIARSASPSPDQFECVRLASQAAIVGFEDSSVQTAFQNHLVRVFRPGYIAKAKAQLERDGKLERLPRIADFEDGKRFVEALEAFCGWRPGELAKQESPGLWTLRLPQLDPDAQSKKLSCWLNAVAVNSDELDRRGIKFGIVGNEAYTTGGQD